jgi:hypothetical protein
LSTEIEYASPPFPGPLYLFAHSSTTWLWASLENAKINVKSDKAVIVLRNVVFILFNFRISI